MNKSQRLVLIVAVLSSFVAFLDGSVVNVALPAITQDLEGGLALQQWVVDAYLITLGALILTAGSLSDLFGRTKILTIGLIAFGVTSLLVAIAPTGLFLIVARLLQGGAGALLVPSSLAIIISAFHGAAQGKAIGSWTAWTGISFLIGPLIGGLLVDSIGWRWIFVINVIPIAVALFFVARLPKQEMPAHRPKLDILGSIFGTVGLGGTVYALIEQSNFGWGSPLVLGTLIIGVLSLAAFIWNEGHSSHPMMPLSLFAVRNFWVGNIATAAIYGALSLGGFVLVIFLQQVLGFSAIEAGLSSVPTTVLMLLLASRFGALSGRFGPRVFMTVGPLVAGAGYFWMLMAGEDANFFTQLLPGILIWGVGMSATVAPLTSAILGSISDAQSGIGSAVNNAVSRVAGLVTIAFASIIIGGGDLDVSGFHRIVIAVGILFVIGGVVSFLGIRNPSKTKADGSQVVEQAPA